MALAPAFLLTTNAIITATVVLAMMIPETLATNTTAARRILTAILSKNNGNGIVCHDNKSKAVNHK